MMSFANETSISFEAVNWLKYKYTRKVEKRGGGTELEYFR